MLMNELKKVVEEKINKGQIISYSDNNIEISFEKVEDKLKVVINRQNFCIETFEKQLISSVNDFKIYTVLVPEIIDKDSLAVAGMIAVKNRIFPCQAIDKVDDMADYISRALVSISMITLDKKETKNLDIQIKRITNSIAEKNIYNICKMCGKDIDKDEELCEDCKSKYIPCADCGTYHFKNEMYLIKKKYYCDNCLNKDTHNVDLTSYSTKVPPIFFGSENERHYGTEIEVERNKQAKYSESQIISILKKYANCTYFKHDGSLNNGFEWITHPCTIEYHQENIVPMLSVLNKLGYGTSSGRCGLHIHVGRVETFGNSDFNQRYSIGRLLWLEEHFTKEMKLVSKRQKFDYCCDLPRPSKNQIERAKEYVNSIKTPAYLIGDNSLDKKKSNLSHLPLSYYILGNSIDRYHAINLKNTPTVEFRLPQGTMSTNDYIAYLQLFDRMITIALDWNLDFTKYSFKELFVGHFECLDNLIAETIE